MELYPLSLTKTDKHGVSRLAIDVADNPLAGDLNICDTVKVGEDKYLILSYDRKIVQDDEVRADTVEMDVTRQMYCEVNCFVGGRPLPIPSIWIVYENNSSVVSKANANGDHETLFTTYSHGTDPDGVDYGEWITKDKNGKLVDVRRKIYPTLDNWKANVGA